MWIEISNVSFSIDQKLFFLRDQHNLLSHPAEGEGSSAIGKVGGKESASPCDCTLSIQWYWRIVRLFAIVDFKSKILGKLTMPLVFALMINALNLLTSFPNLQVADRQQPQAYPGTLDDLKFVWFTRYIRVLHLLHCSALCAVRKVYFSAQPNKLRHILKVASW